MSHGAAAPTETPARVLRFAVAMRGGVSLAVWIGGALAEIDRLRRGADPFAKGLLGVAGFDRLEVDILTGASAGGLNAALGGAAITRGVPLRLRQVWIDAADIDALLESDIGQGSVTRRSVLNGDYFLGEVCDNLTGLMSQGPPNPAHAGPVEVFLAATVFGGVEVTQASDPKFSDRRREAYFHFRHLADWPSFSDFAHSPQLIDRLGRAARATASFPGAFEPVAVEPGDFAGRLHLPGTPMTSPIRLYDGGVVDNIPVSRAIRAAAASPAQETVRRWVVFLHPSPSASAAPAPTGGVPGVIAVVKDLLSGRGVETLLDDLEVLRAHNRAVEAYQLERYSLCNQVLAGVDLSRPPRLDSRSIDADRLYGLLDSPAEALGWIPIGMASPGSPISSLDDDARYALRISFLAALVERSTTVRPYARLVRVAHLLVEWIRWVERFTAAPSAEWRRIVYDVMLVAQLVDGALDLRFLTTGADLRIDDLVVGLDAVGLSPDLRHLAGALAAAHPTGTGWQPLRDRLDAAGREALDRLASGRLPTAGGPLAQDREQLDDVLLDHLATIGGELAARSAAIGSAASRPGSRSPDPSLFTLLRAALGQEPTAARARSALLAVDWACSGLHGGRAGGAPQSMEYIRISGAAPSPLAKDSPFASQALPRFENIVETDGAIDPDDKLSGNSLANFAAFVSKRFRANDWMWGRMDAAAGMVETLLRSRARRGGSLDERMDMVRRTVNAPFASVEDPALAPAATVICEALWAEHRVSVSDELVAADMGIAGWEITRQLLTARWQLEILLEEVPRVLTEAVQPGMEVEGAPAGADPAVPAGDPVPVAKAAVEDLLARYETSPRRVGHIWGTRGLTALGVRAARWTGRALVPGSGPAALAKRVVLSAPLLVATAAVLTRGDFLLAWSLLVNGVLVARLTPSAGVAVVVVSVVAGGAFWMMCVGKSRTGMVAGAVAFALHAWGMFTAVSGRGRLSDPAHFTADAPWPSAADRDPVVTGALVVFAVVAVASFLLWRWAKLRWVTPVAVCAALAMAGWTIVGAWSRPDGATGWWGLLEPFGSMWVPTILIVVVTSLLAISFRPEDRPLPAAPTEV